jgi:hypothetical protein
MGLENISENENTGNNGNDKEKSEMCLKINNDWIKEFKSYDEATAKKYLKHLKTCDGCMKNMCIQLQTCEIMKEKTNSAAQLKTLNQVYENICDILTKLSEYEK